MSRQPSPANETELSPIFTEFLQIAESQSPLTAMELLNAWAELDLLRAKTLEEMSTTIPSCFARSPAFLHFVTANGLGPSKASTV